MADEVSWLVVERGWEVVDRDARSIGRVERVLGDEDKDIFDGLAVATKLIGKARYVPAERVTSIVDGRVTLDLTHDEADRLETVP